MTVFDKCFLFLRNPAGGVEDLQSMKSAGFDGVFCNVGDYPVGAWEQVIVPRAKQVGMFCGPWARTQTNEHEFDPNKLSLILQTADRWGSPLICNSEKELDGSGDDLTSYIVKQIGDRDAAISMEAWPYASVDWSPFADLPVLPQIFPAESSAGKDPEGCRQQWYAEGIRCVYFTFGSYGGMRPGDFSLQAPYSVYTADDCGSNYAAWKPTSTGYQGCVDQPPPPLPLVPANGDGMDKIGDQHGITAFIDWVQAQPGMPARKPNYDPAKPGTWPWPERLERTLNMLREDHDEEAEEGVF